MSLGRIFSGALEVRGKGWGGSHRSIPPLIRKGRNNQPSSFLPNRDGPINYTRLTPAGKPRWNSSFRISQTQYTHTTPPAVRILAHCIPTHRSTKLLHRDLHIRRTVVLSSARRTFVLISCVGRSTGRTICHKTPAADPENIKVWQLLATVALASLVLGYP